MGRRISRTRDCYCYTCQKEFHYLGITNHRKMHRTKREDCRIGFTYGDVYVYEYSKLKERQGDISSSEEGK